MADSYDMTMILVTHHAFRRDLRRLADATTRPDAGEPRRRASLELGWRTLKTMLESHHVGEDDSMWPRMRTGLRGREDDLAVLDAMEAEHQRIEPLIKAVDDALGTGAAGSAAFTEAVHDFTTEVGDHLTHEEDAAFPLVKVAMTPGQWSKAVVEMRGGLAAIRAAPEFFPWLLDDATSEDRSAVLGRVPLPLRLLYQRVWLPGYSKQSRF